MMWLPLYILFIAAVSLYWAGVAARANGDCQTYFSAGHSLSPWISALVLSGASISGWAVMVGGEEIARNGFGHAAILQAGIALALPGVFFFKRIWLLGERFHISSLGELLRAYWNSEFLVAFSAVVATLFAVAFAGIQMAALSRLVVLVTDNAISVPVATAVLGFILVGYVVIGGMRVVGYLGAIQTVLAGAAIVGFAGFSILQLGGFGALNAGLLQLAADPAAAGKFIVSGVVQFTAGVGREGAAGHDGTALASLAMAFALMGLQSSPMAMKVVLSTSSPRAIAAGQTWVMAGAFGAMIALCVACFGAAKLIDPSKDLSGVLTTVSPWFMAWLFIGLLAGVQLMAGLALLSAGETLIRNVYKPWFHSSLSRRNTVTVTRIAIALLVLASGLMQVLTPVTLSMLASLALPLSLQLWTPLLGMTWIRWFTRPGVVTGVGFGIAGVLLTEPFGIALLSAFGLELPWGRAPWTMTSAVWGMAANLLITVLVSAFTQRHPFGEEAQEARRFLHGILRPSARARSLRSTAWSLSLAWFFFAVGPGLIFGNYAFNKADGSWALGMPSLWGWGLISWVSGLGLVWFLSYKMEMASPHTQAITAYQPPPRLRPAQSLAERERLRALLITVGVGFFLVVLTVLSFGH